MQDDAQGQAGQRRPAGRGDALQDVLKDESFVSQHLGDDTGARKVLYEDPDLGFTILAHSYEDASESKPHDHGPSWAIYGQARGETEMTTWELIEAATPEKPGKVARPASRCSSRAWRRCTTRASCTPAP